METIKEVQEEYFILNKELLYNEGRQECNVRLFCFSKFTRPTMIQEFTIPVSYYDEKIKKQFKKIKLITDSEQLKAIQSLSYIHYNRTKETPKNGIVIQQCFDYTTILCGGCDYSRFTKDFLCLIEKKHFFHVKPSYDKILDYIELYLDYKDIRFYIDGDVVDYELFYLKHIKK